MQRHTLLQYIQRRQQFTQRMLPRLSMMNQGVMNHAPTAPLYFAPPVLYPVPEANFSHTQTSTYEIQEINEMDTTQVLPIIDTSHLPNQSKEANFLSDSVGTDVSRPQAHAPHSHLNIDTIQEKHSDGHGEPVPTPSISFTLEETGDGHGEPVPTPSANFTPNDSVGTASSRPHPQPDVLNPVPRPRRARIEEQPSRPPQPTADASITPTSSHTQPIQQTQMAQRKAKTQPPTPQDNKISRAQAEADALFTSTPARSPQEWLAMLTQSQKKDVPSPSQQKEQNARPVRDDIGYSRGGSGEDVGSGPLWSPVVPSSQDVGERPSRLPVVLPAIPRANQSTHGTNAQLHPLHSPVVSYSEAPHSPINPVYSLKAEQPEENIPANDTASASSRPLTNVSVSTSPTNLIPNDENSQPKQTNSKPSKPSTSPLPSPVASKDYKENTLTDSVRNDVAHPHPDVDTMREERTHERDQSLPTSPAIITPKDVGADVSRPQADTPGEPLSQRAQQFLRPIVDIDPTNVRIHRDAQAAQFATAHQADAVTTGNEIMLAAGHAEDTPQTLALLAHEMTHVARKRELRFVPPIVNTPTNIDPHVDRIPARGTPTMTNAEKPSRAIVEASLAVVLPVSSAPHTQKPIATNIVEAADEERLALQVEQQAFYYAQQQTQQPIQAQEPQYRAGVDQQDQPTSVTNELVMPVARSSNAVDNWGGLPAPWEPLPNWLTTASTPEGYNTATAAPLAMPPMPSVQTQTAQVQFNAPMPSPAVNGNGHVDIATGSISTDGSAAGDVQRAGVERSMNTAQQIGPVQQMTGAAPAPDLDDLARQVYTVLKRRLGVEHRRL